MAAELCIVIVNMNTREWLRRCLLSLRAHGEVEKEIVVVDNLSEDGSARMVRRYFPEVDLVCNPRRLGFARNNNLGAARGRAPVLLFLNPDTEVPPGALRNMLEAMALERAYGVFGCKILDGEGALERSTGSFPTLWSIFLDRFLPRFPLLEPALQRYAQRHYRGYDRRRPVDWVTGACLWIRREALAAVGGWDGEIFMYYEDADLCYRSRRAGYPVLYVPRASIYHFRNKTPMGSLSRKMQWSKGLHAFVRKHYGPFRRWIYPRVLRLPGVD